MTLNSEGLEKAKEAHDDALNNPVFVDCRKCAGTGYHHGFGETGHDPDWCLNCGGSKVVLAAGEQDRPLEAAIAAYLDALPPVDGLEVVMEKICHKEQIGIWANEITSALALSDFLREEWTFDDSVDLEREIAAQLLDIIKAAFTHPALDLVASLSQASSVIAGLKAEIDDFRDEWQAEYDARLAANTARRAAEARISSLEEEIKRLREALKPFAGKADWPLIQMTDDLPVLCQVVRPSYETVPRILASFGLSVSDFRAARQALEDHNG